MAAYSVTAHSQTFFDPANLIFEITLPSDTPASLNALEDTNNEEGIRYLESVELYQDAIENIQLSTNNPYEYELLEEYSDLGDVYQSLAQHDEAISSFDNALQITKIQNGLYNLDQLPLLQKIIQSHLALGDLDNATLWQEYSHYLHLENYDAADPAMVEATFALTQWYIATFFRDNFQSANQKLEMIDNMTPRLPRSTAGLVEDQGMIEEFTANPNAVELDNILNGNVRRINPRDIEHPTLLKVGNIYEELQNNIYATEQPDIGSIVQTARRIAELSFITKQEMDFERQNPNFNVDYANTREQLYRTSQQRMDHSYDSGRNALQYIVSLLKSVEARPGLLASAIVELGDWHFAYGKIQAAGVTYQEAYSMMASMGIPTEAADEAFNEPIPKQIPRMATHMFTSRSAGVSNDINLAYLGYFDVSFNIDSQGNVEGIAFDDSSHDEARNIQSLIVSSLNFAKYRPRFNNGEFIDSERLNLRYYYSY
ncbi:MAG: tetratricopeptide repeat protein [Gammaproteobacteria bacterium]|nr:tetratricopeptide repeat protein [Gammaproteobacteria bacterium]